MKYGQFIMGPAGCGKSTYCRVFQEHFENIGIPCIVVNLDPAAEELHYKCDIDIRDLICVSDVMEETDYGPNGGLVYAMEYIMQNSQWLEEKLSAFVDDDYLLFDCPGQIELYSHIPVMRELIQNMDNWDFRCCGVYCLDVSFLTDAPKFVGGVLSALTAMIRMELPHVTVITKCDLLNDAETFYNILEKPPGDTMSELNMFMPPGFRELNVAICSLLEEYSLVGYVPLNVDDEETIERLTHVINNAIQYGESLEPRDNFDFGSEER